MMDILEIILSEHSLPLHFVAYEENPQLYGETLLEVFSDSTKSIALRNKSRAIAVLIQHKESQLLRSLYPFLNLPEITLACEILDSNRHARQLKNKIKLIEASSQELNQPNDSFIQLFIDQIIGFSYTLEEQKNINRRNHRIRRKLDRLTLQMVRQQDLSEGMHNLSLTNAKSKLIKEWTRSLNRTQLEMSSPEQWRRLANLVHLNPKSDLKLNWFLPYCFNHTPLTNQ